MVKIKLILAKYRKWFYVCGSLLVCGLIALLYDKYKMNAFINKPSSETIAVVGTLLGAVIGGLFSLLGSVYVNQKQLKAQSHIKRKNLIYKPLYDEIAEIEYNILSENPYPITIAFKPREYGQLKIPCYAVWGRIKTDSRRLETPKKLAKEMDKLYTTVENYQNARKCKTENITRILNEIQIEVLGNNTLVNNGIYVIDYLLQCNHADLFDIYEGPINGRINITEEERIKISHLFYERCKDNPEIMRIKKAKHEWEIQQRKVIKILSSLIQYVNIKYEG